MVFFFVYKLIAIVGWVDSGGLLESSGVLSVRVGRGSRFGFWIEYAFSCVSRFFVNLLGRRFSEWSGRESSLFFVFRIDYVIVS